MGNLNGVYDVKNHLDNREHGSCDNGNDYFHCCSSLMVQKVVFKHQKRPLNTFGEVDTVFFDL